MYDRGRYLGVDGTTGAGDEGGIDAAALLNFLLDAEVTLRRGIVEKTLEDSSRAYTRPSSGSR